MKYIIYCLFFAVVGCFEDSKNYQLPKNAQPIHYDLNIYASDNQKGSIRNMTPYSANVSIQIQILKPTQTLTLHSKFHKIIYERSSLTRGEKNYKISSHSNLTETVTLVFDEVLEEGFYDLYFEIDGYELPKYENPIALYIEIVNITKHERSIVMATNFEMTFARWLFPCWDEPSYEATFNVSILHWKDAEVASNMPILSNRDVKFGPERKHQINTTFIKTPKMPIYKLYFMTKNKFYDSYELKDFNFTLWHRHEVRQKITYAANVGKTALTNLGTTVTINAPLPYFNVILHNGNRMYGNSKDLMGLWENETLIDEGKDALSKQVHSALGMIRTITHEWIKHILTPATIDDFWITGGIAIYKHCSVFSQDSKFSDNFDFCLFLNYDSVMNVNPEKELDYDQIKHYKIPNILHLYRKAAAVMFTIKNLLQNDDFDTCINQILNDFREKTISANEFWEILQTKVEYSELRDINLRNSFEPYIFQTGYPEINVDAGWLDDIKVTFTSSSTPTNSWPIPIKVISTFEDKFHQECITLNNEVIYESVDGRYIYLFNNNSLDLFRVNYNLENWMKLIELMNSDKYENIPPLNRAKLLEDAYFFYKKGEIKKNLLLNLSDYFGREDHYIPWFVAGKIFPESYKTAEANDKQIILQSVKAFCARYNSKSNSKDTLAVSIKKKIAESFEKMQEN